MHKGLSFAYLSLTSKTYALVPNLQVILQISIRSTTLHKGRIYASVLNCKNMNDSGLRINEHTNTQNHVLSLCKTVKLDVKLKQIKAGQLHLKFSFELKSVLAVLQKRMNHRKM